MRKRLISTDGSEYILPPISYTEFMVLDLWSGDSNMAYATWLSKNDFHEADSFNEEFLQTTALILDYVPSQSIIWFNPSGDGETWIKYDLEMMNTTCAAQHKNGNARLWHEHKNNGEEIGSKM